MSGMKPDKPAYLIVNDMIVRTMEGIYNDTNMDPLDRERHVYKFLVKLYESDPKVKEKLKNDPVNEDVVHQMARNYASETLEKLAKRGKFDPTVL
jgi:hypothetical protein